MSWNQLAMGCAIAALMVANAPLQAASKSEIDAEVRAALETFRKEVPAGHELARKAAGVLVFPSIVKAGIGVGGEFGEGSLQIDGRTIDYYNLASVSVGFQLGAQSRSQILLFMTPKALADFRRSDGWKAGVDGSVALATLGAGGTIDSDTVQKPIIAFVFSNEGLMYNLTLEGSKITRVEK